MNNEQIKQLEAKIKAGVKNKTLKRCSHCKGKAGINAERYRLDPLTDKLIPKMVFVKCNGCKGKGYKKIEFWRK